MDGVSGLSRVPWVDLVFFLGDFHVGLDVEAEDSCVLFLRRLSSFRGSVFGLRFGFWVLGFGALFGARGQVARSATPLLWMFG